MSEQESICKDCQSDLTKEQHKEDCPILAKQKADALAKEAQQEKILADELSKQAIEQAKKDLQTKHDAEIARIKKENSDKNKKMLIINQIQKLVPNEKMNVNEYLKESLETLKELYKKVSETVKDESANGAMEFDVSCPICSVALGETRTEQEAIEILNEHKKKEHPKAKTASNPANLIFGILCFSLIAGGIFAVYKMMKKKKESKTE